MQLIHPSADEKRQALERRIYTTKNTHIIFFYYPHFLLLSFTFFYYPLFSFTIPYFLLLSYSSFYFPMVVSRFLY